MNTTVTFGPQPAIVTRAQDGTGRGAPDTPQPAQPGPQRPAGGSRALATIADLVVSFVAPLVAYHLIRPHVGSSATALALSGAIPVVYTLATLAISRRLNPIAVVGVISFAFGVLISWASGGSALALELQDPAFFGLIGLVFLGSVVIGRPLHRQILRWLSRSSTQYAGIAERAQRRTSMVVTSIIAVALLTHSAAVAVLALTQSVSTFNNLQNVVGLPFFGAGFAVMMMYRSRLQGRQQAATVPAGDGQHDDGSGDDPS